MARKKKKQPKIGLEALKKKNKFSAIGAAKNLKKIKSSRQKIMDELFKD